MRGASGKHHGICGTEAAMDARDPSILMRADEGNDMRQNIKGNLVESGVARRHGYRWKSKSYLGGKDE
jgi:hypothetical protein